MDLPVFRMRSLMPFLLLMMLLLMYSFRIFFVPLSGWLRLVRFLLHLEAGGRLHYIHLWFVGHIAYSITTTVLPCCLVVKCPTGWEKKILTTVTSIRLSLCLSKSDMSCLVLLSWDSLVYLPRHCLNVALLAHSSCWMKCPGRYWFLLDCYPAQKRRKCSIPTEYNN